MTSKKIIIINGPNLNLLGQRQPEIYGNVSFKDFLNNLQREFSHVEIDYFQSNEEGEIVTKIQNCSHYNGMVINAAAYSHTSIAIADSLAFLKIPIIEVHISNIFARESFRHHSYISAHCKAVICGLGLEGYRVAIQYLLSKI